MKILVTGGAGFIGSHLLELLAGDKNYEVVVLDNLSSGFKENVPQGMKLVVEDIRSQAIAKLFEQEHFDAVVHLAAQTMVPYSIEHPDEDCDINLAGLINVLENCRKYQVKTVLFASSAAVYGDNESVPLQEDFALQPMSFYGITKMTSEHYLRVYHDLYGINSIVFRFANVYGERQGEGGEGGVVSIFCKLLSAGKAVTVYGTGEQTRDFVYAGDVAKALQAGLKAQGYQTINVSTEYETSVNQLLEAFAAVVDGKMEVHYAPARQGDIFRSSLDNTRLKESLAVIPQMQLHKGIQKTYHDYLKRGK